MRSGKIWLDKTIATNRPSSGSVALRLATECRKTKKPDFTLAAAKSRHNSKIYVHVKAGQN